ncbi:MAG: hypothetical protein PF450_05740, partial [Bacteroidales bacterium]|nr:hypothetical protein [Bacteroidales bacterium]
QKISAFLLVAICFAWMAGFEYMREIVRKPFVLYENMYSTSIRPERKYSDCNAWLVTQLKIIMG